MFYELAICFRYLRPRFSRAYISFNTLISIFGIAVGVTTLITVIAVMTGFGKRIENGFTGFYSHIVVFRKPVNGSGRSYDRITDYSALLQRIEKTEGVVAASPFVLAHVALGHQGMSYTRPLRAVDPRYERKTSTIESKIVKGSFDFSVEVVGGEDPEFDDEAVRIVSILISEIVAEEIGLEVGDVVNIASSSIGAMGPGRRTLPAKIAGIFSYGWPDQDMYLYGSLETGQILQSLGDDISGISVMTENVNSVDETKKNISRNLGPDYNIKTWRELSPDLFALLKEERFIMYFIVALIIAVAALNIISSLTMMVNHKRKEIGILRSLGAKRRSITAIFGFMGILIGGLGTGIGTAGGLLISLNFNAIRSWVFRISGFNLFSVHKTIPAEVDGADVALICGIAMLLCMLVSIYPAWKASRLNPVEALRYE